MSYDFEGQTPTPPKRKTFRDRLAGAYYSVMLWLALDAPFSWVNSIGLRMVLGPARHKKHS